MRFYAVIILTVGLGPWGLFSGSLRIIYRGNIPSVRLRVDGRSMGVVRRGEPRTVEVARGHSKVTLYRGRIRHSRRIYVPRLRTRTVVIRKPYFRGVILTLEGRYEWARVYINGKQQGRVYREQPRYIPLRPARTYRIQAIRRALIRGHYSIQVARFGREAVRRLTFDF